MNIDEKTLELVDDLSSLTENSRTVVMLALIGEGIKGFVEELDMTLENLKKDKKRNQEKISGKIEKLKKLREKFEV